MTTEEQYQGLENGMGIRNRKINSLVN